MPFRKSAKITMENLDDEPVRLTYQIDYTLTDVPAQTGYFHAQFRRTNPLPYKSDYVILDGVKGWGQYVGTYLAWGTHSNGWWGEGEVKFFIDGDGKFPTICGTGTEDYFCGGFDFVNRTTHQYQEYTTPYAGLAQVIRPDGLWVVNEGGCQVSVLQKGTYLLKPRLEVMRMGFLRWRLCIKVKKSPT